MKGFWQLNIFWPDEDEDLTDLSLNLETLDQAVDVVKRYHNYEQASITFVAFHDPKRY